MKIDSPELERLRQLTVELNVQWQMFDELFSDPTNLVIYNRTGPQFWNHLRQYLLDLLFISISRFFDPPKSCGEENFSLETVLNFKEVAPIRGPLKAVKDEMQRVWENGIKPWRHKHLSHIDVSVQLGVERLPDVPISDVRDLVAGISRFVHDIDLQLNKVGQGYHVAIHGWVPQVLAYLRRGVEKTDEKREHARRFLGEKPAEGASSAP